MTPCAYYGYRYYSLKNKYKIFVNNLTENQLAELNNSDNSELDISKIQGAAKVANDLKNNGITNIYQYNSILVISNDQKSKILQNITNLKYYFTDYPQFQKTVITDISIKYNDKSSLQKCEIIYSSNSMAILN